MSCSIAIANSAMNLLLANTSVLTVSNINATENGGVYECVVLNDAGFDVERSMLYVRPLIVEHPMDHLVMNGSNITLSCRAESFPYPEYRWEMMNPDTNMFENMPGAISNVLELNMIQFSDFGMYRCCANAPTINEEMCSNNATVTGE